MKYALSLDICRINSVLNDLPNVLENPLPTRYTIQSLVCHYDSDKRNDVMPLIKRAYKITKAREHDTTVVALDRSEHHVSVYKDKGKIWQKFATINYQFIPRQKNEFWPLTELLPSPVKANVLLARMDLVEKDLRRVKDILEDLAPQFHDWSCGCGTCKNVHIWGAKLALYKEEKTKIEIYLA